MSLPKLALKPTPNWPETGYLLWYTTLAGNMDRQDGGTFDGSACGLG